MRPSAVKFLVLAALLAPLSVPATLLAKTSDRQQDMNIESDKFEGDNTGNGKATYSQNVVVTQGTLTINADVGTVYMRDGAMNQAVFTGKPVRLKQQLDDGTWMDAQADRMEYDMTGEVLTLIGNYNVTSAKGSSSGQRMVYNTKTGAVQAGGDGTRVKTVIKPKTAQGQATVGQPQPIPTTPTDKP